jgi:hypothetical protein
MPPRFICQLRHFRALAVAAGIILSTVPMVQAAGSERSTRGADIIRQAYPTAQNVSERTFRVGDETIALPADAGDNPHELNCRMWPARPELILIAAPLMTSKFAL